MHYFYKKDILHIDETVAYITFVHTNMPTDVAAPCGLSHSKEIITTLK